MGNCLCFNGAPFPNDPYLHLNARHWETGMCHAPCNNCPGFCGAIFCPCCCAVYLRYLALNKDMNKYRCCQGYVCGDCTKCTDGCAKCCPWPCLCIEACFCEACAISATRLYVQEERQIITDPCDNRIMRFNNCMQILSCICSILALFIRQLESAATLIRLIAKIVYLITQACMQAQTHLELKRHPTFKDYGITTVQPAPQAMPVRPNGAPAPMQAFVAYPPGQHPAAVSPYPPAGYPPPALVPQGYPPPGYTSDGAAYPYGQPVHHQPYSQYPPQGQGVYPPQGAPNPYPAQSYPSHQAYPYPSPQAQPYPQQQYPPQGYPPQAYGYPNHSTV
eukprot:m.5112 g.5112  ORF g.5112 m.5112 type:complete len:334 (+) comp4447_c0_seq2:208-1209(+)